MAVFTQKQIYELTGRMSKTILDDDNGASRMRALLLHHSSSIPVLDGEVLLRPWQNVLLVEYDTGPRTRTRRV